MIVVNAVKHGIMANWRLIYLWRDCLQLIGEQRRSSGSHEHHSFKEYFSQRDLPGQLQHHVTTHLLGIWTYRR